MWSANTAKKFGLFLFYLAVVGVQVFGQEPDVLLNVSYGPDPSQKMNIYLPEGRNMSLTKSIVLVHGGGWNGGTKEDMNGFVSFFQLTFPNKFAIFNIGYRLGSIESPAFPKSVQDIDIALKFIKAKSNDYFINPAFGLVGASAGGHLSMLYGYAYAYNGNNAVDVKVICNLQGPTSLVDPSYTENPFYDSLFLPLVGNITYEQNPTAYYAASPIAYVNAQSPKTIGFYGDSDPLIPSTQGEILEDKLDSLGIYNKYYLYPGAGHGNLTEEQTVHMYKKIEYFFNNHM